jgi:hypothetical protein
LLVFRCACSILVALLVFVALITLSSMQTKADKNRRRIDRALRSPHFPLFRVRSDIR